MPAATGNYIINATWSGDVNYPRASTTRNLAVMPFEEQSVFSVTSNSTLSAITYNSTSREFSFTVTGSEGSLGYVDAHIAKSLVGDARNIRIYVDDDQTNCSITSTDDSWILAFSYTHSTHNVIIDLHSAMITGRPDLPLIYLIPVVAAIALVVGIAITRRMQKPQKDPIDSASNT